MKEIIASIEKAQTIDELDEIVEKAAFNEELTNEEYCEIYEKALRKAQSWQPQIKG